MVRIGDLVTGTELYSCFHTTSIDTTPKEFIRKWFKTEDE